MVSEVRVKRNGVIRHGMHPMSYNYDRILVPYSQIIFCLPKIKSGLSRNNHHAYLRIDETEFSQIYIYIFFPHVRLETLSSTLVVFVRLELIITACTRGFSTVSLITVGWKNHLPLTGVFLYRARSHGFSI